MAELWGNGGESTLEEMEKIRVDIAHTCICTSTALTFVHLHLLVSSISELLLCSLLPCRP